MKAAILFGSLMIVGCVESPASKPMPPKGGKADSADQTGQGGPIQQLSCSSGNATMFRATLDGSTYDAGSHYFVVRDASIADNYSTAQLTCTGYQLDGIQCIGFWFDLKDEIGVVDVTQSGSSLTASYSALRGTLVGASLAPWPCTVQ
jgi:hypothetical protein